MSGHLFILSQRQITGTIAENKKLPVSAKQWEAGADEIKPDDLIILASGNKNGPLALWLTAKAATGSVKMANGGYIRLSFVRLKDNQSSYVLVEGIATGQSLKELNWKKLDDQEVSACFFDTVLCDKALKSMKTALSRTLPKGLGIDSESVLRSVLFNGASSNNGAVLKEWHESELLVNEPKYRQVLRKRLSELDGFAFEELLTEFFKHSVFAFDDVRITKKTNDGGIDLFLTRQDDVLGHLLVVGQCKRQNKTVSALDVRALCAVRNHTKASRAIFITTSKFSPQAMDVGKEDGHIELIDGDRLASLFFRHAEKVPGIWRLIRQSVQAGLWAGG